MSMSIACHGGRPGRGYKPTETQLRADSMGKRDRRAICLVGWPCMPSDMGSRRGQAARRLSVSTSELSKDRGAGTEATGVVGGVGQVGRAPRCFTTLQDVERCLGMLEEDDKSLAVEGFVMG